MSKILSLKVKVALISLVALLSMAVIGTFAFAKAEEKSLGDITFTMQNGAELLVEGDDGVNGLTFTAKLSSTDYDWLVSSVGDGRAYVKMETGLIIAPLYYNENTAINEANLFGSSSTYDWAEYVNGNYTYSGNKIRVININANNWVDAGDYNLYKGSIVDIKEANETEEFFAVAYVKLTDVNDVSVCKFSNSTTAILRDMAVIAVQGDTLTVEQKAWVSANWLPLESVEDNTEYLVDVKDKLTFDMADAVYNVNAKAIISAYGRENLSFELTDLNGKVLNQRVLDVTNSDNLRLWSIKVSHGGKVVYTGKADVYDSSKSAVWNDMKATSGIENAVLIRDEDSGMKVASYTGSYTTEDGKPVVKITTESKGFYVSVLPIHSKAYYEKYQDGDYTFTYNWKYSSTVAWNSGSQGFYFINGASWNGSNKPDVWYTNSLTLKQIVENWDAFTKFESRVWGERFKVAMFATYNNLLGNGKTDIFVNLSLVDNSAVNTLVNLNDIDNQTEVALSSVVNEGIYSNLVNSYPNAKWYIADTIKGAETEILDKEKVDLTAFDKKAYTLKVVDDGSVVFSADFDIFDSTEPIVWNTVSKDTIDYVKVYQFVNSKEGDGLLENAVSITDEGFFKATGNEFYYYSYKENEATTIVSPLEYMSVTVLPLHSKSYYQRYYGEGLVLRMRMIKEGLQDFSTVQFMDDDHHDYWAKTHGNITISLDKLIDNWIAYTGTGMTTNTDAWTVMTRASGNKIDTMQVFNISLGEISLTQPAVETEGTGALKGKQVTVIGDSISTWNYEADGSTYPHVSNNATHGQNIVMNDTWWKQVIDNYGMELVVNRATSGATAGHGVLMGGTPTSNSKLNIASTNKSLSAEGVNPDLVLVYIGMNDMCRGSVIIKDGDDINSQAFYDMIPNLFTEYNSKYESNKADYGMALSQSLGLDTYARAYAYILYSIQKNYPNADIVCLNMPAKMSTAPAYNEVIDTIAGHYGVPVVDLYTAFKTAGGSYTDNTYCYDALHPNANGFDIMSNAVIAKMNEIYGK